MKAALRTNIQLLCLIALFAIACMLIVSGCQSSPYEWETKFYTIETNVVPQVITETNQVFVTNTVERVVTQTNWESGTPVITVLPVKETIVTSSPVVTFSTNQLVTYTYTANTNAQAIGETAGSIFNLVAPGTGSLVTAAIGGLAALWGGLRSRRMSKSAAVLAQGIEIYGEVVKGLGPIGADVDKRVKSALQAHQAEAQVLQDVLRILENTVDNSEAKKAAEAIREFMAPAALVPMAAVTQPVKQPTV